MTAFVQSAFASDEKMSNFQKEFLIEKEAKIRFLAWPGSSEFELTFQQADELGYLHDDPKSESIKDADLLLFFLDGWGDLEKIPQNYEDFTRIFDSIDGDGGEVTLHYDVDFGEESGGVRLIRTSLSFPPNTGTYAEQSMRHSVRAAVRLVLKWSLL